MIAEVPLCARHSVLKSAALCVIEPVGSGIPGTHGRRRRNVRTRTLHEMRHGKPISTPESVPVGVPHRGWNVGMAEFVATSDVVFTMTAQISSCARDAIVEAAALNVIPGVVRTIPVVPILCKGG